MDNVTARILSADTVDKAWALFEALLDNPNGYSDSTILENARAYVVLREAITK